MYVFTFVAKIADAVRRGHACLVAPVCLGVVAMTSLSTIAIPWPWRNA
jgi:hypothetical protein